GRGLGAGGAATTRTSERVLRAVVLSALPEMTVVLDGWKATARTGPAWLKNCSSFPLARSQARVRLSAAPVTILVLSALNDSDRTSAGWGSVRVSLPSAAFHTLSALPTAAPTRVKSRL